MALWAAGVRLIRVFWEPPVPLTTLTCRPCYSLVQRLSFKIRSG